MFKLIKVYVTFPSKLVSKWFQFQLMHVYSKASQISCINNLRNLSETKIELILINFQIKKKLFTYLDRSPIQKLQKNQTLKETLREDFFWLVFYNSAFIKNWLKIKVGER